MAPEGTAQLAARARLFDTGHNRKTDAHDAHAVAVVAVRTAGLRVLSYDVELEALRMLVDRREELTRQRVRRPTLSTSIPSLRALTDAHQLARPTSRLAHTTRVLSTESTRNGSA